MSQTLRGGHPCWRKITDPILLSEDDEEIIVLDPDLYFPNRFTFEPTPESGVYVMRQGPNCLFPPAAVWRAMDQGIPLANHVDIGVAQMRADAIDLDWLDDLAARLRVQDFADYMHIEAIVWAAAAMRFGGGHLGPLRWRCWERGYLKRALAALGAPGAWLLRWEPLDRVKCIHVSGPSKWWVVEAVERGALGEAGAAHEAPSAMVPYVELTRRRYRAERALKRLIGR